MSTGEVINANGAPLTADMIRGGFHKFPQSDVVLVSPDVWPQIHPLQVAAAYPFSADEDDAVPPGELWYIGQENPPDAASTHLLGRIINIATEVDTSMPIGQTQTARLSVTIPKKSTADFTVNFATPFPDGNYTVVASLGYPSLVSGTASQLSLSVFSKLNSNAGVVVEVSNASNADAAANIHIIAIHD